MTYKTEAIILRSFDVKEYDRLYTIFSKEHGKMCVLGIGTRKPKAKLASGLDPLTRSELFCIKGRQKDRVAGVIIDQQHPNLKKNLEALACAKKCFWIVSEIVPENEQLPEVYDLMKIFLRQLDDQKVSSKAMTLRIAVLWKAVRHAGYEPRLFHCASCGKKVEKKEKHTFILPTGVLCGRCQIPRGTEGAVQVSENAIKAIRVFLHKEPKIIAKVSAKGPIIKELEKVTVIFLQKILNKKIVL